MKRTLNDRTTAGEEDVCLFCGIPGSPFLHENGYLGKRCHTCGLVYTWPRPRASTIISSYAHDSANVPAGEVLRSDLTKKLEAQVFLSILGNIRKRGRMLDVGAGAGYFLMEARKAGYEVAAIEPNAQQARFMSHEFGIRCTTDALSADVYPGETFDIIMNCNVLSHFHDPISAFLAMRAKLAPDGVIMTVTGNFGDTSPRFHSIMRPFSYPDHLYFFSRDSLDRLWKSTGFTTVSSHRWSLLYQLLFLSSLRAIMRRVRGNAGGQKSERGQMEERGGHCFESDGRRTRLRAQLVHYLTYGLGGLLCFPGHPQSLLTICTKADEGDRQTQA